MYSQSTYPIVDPYSDLTGVTLDELSGGESAYDGEYMLKYGKLFWKNIAGSLSYKVEAVSYPFISPNIFTTGDADGLSVRNLVLPENNQYGSVNVCLGKGNGWNNLLFKEIERKEFCFNTCSGCTGDNSGTFSSQMGLASVFYITNGPLTYNSSRLHFPHTVLKFSLYIHQASIESPIIDSLSFIYDNTRGKMHEYPFRADNIYTPFTSSTSIYDVFFEPTLLHKPDQLFTDNNNSDWFNYGTQTSGTINYFPYKDIKKSQFLSQLFPEDISDFFYDGYSYSYVHPAPYTVFMSYLQSDNGGCFAGYKDGGCVTEQTGVRHNYYIDKYIDLRIINPVEKIIYNPSETHITTNLTFPTGYIFKTVYGKLPERTLIESLDNGLYEDQREILAPSDKHSIYYLENNSNLTIEPCVTIMDAEIIVKSGSKLIYDPARTYGNFTITLQGGTVDTNPANFSANYGTCNQLCYQASYYNVINKNIEVNETWTSSNLQTYFPTSVNNTAKIGGTITVKSGNTLTINEGIRLEFGQLGKIVVEHNAKLIVNGTNTNKVIFTNSCKEMWKGIEVLGNTTSNTQYPSTNSPQAYVKLNYVIFENSLNGIISKNMDIDDYTPVYTGGGIIIATNSEFLNNHRAIQFYSFKNFIPGTRGEKSNLSYFNNCIFETNDNYMFDYAMKIDHKRRAPEKMIYLFDVKDVGFSRCTFRNNVTQQFEPHLRGIALHLFDASIQLKMPPSLPSLYANKFTGFSDAIWAESSGSGDFIKIDGCIFNSNVYSIVLDGVLSSKIVRNTINIPASETTIVSDDIDSKGYDSPAGIYLRLSSGYHIEENSFTATSTGTGQGSFGIITNSTTDASGGNGFGNIYRNTYAGLTTAVQAEYNNGSNSTGTQIKCNTFNNTITESDIKVVGKYVSAMDVTYGSLRDQGACLGTSVSTPAGNLFKNPTASFENLFIQYSSGFVYHHHNQATQFIKPSKNSNNITLIPCASNYSSLESCPTTLTSNLIQVNADISLTKSAISNQNILINSLIDGGNSNELLHKLNTNMSQGAIKNLLLSKSPYLSDKVLITAIDKNLPPGHIKQVLVANSPLSEKVQKLVQEKQLPQGIINEINIVQTGVSEREQLYKTLGYYEFQLKLLYNQLLQYGSEQENIDTIKPIIKENEQIVEKYLLLPVEIEERKFAEATQLLDELKDYEGETLSGFVKEQEIALNLKSENKTIYEMDAMQRQTIENIVIESSEIAFTSKAVLKRIKGSKYEKKPIIEVVNSNKNLTFSYTTPQDLSNKDIDFDKIEFTIVPNPATSNSVIEINIIENYTTSKLLIVDVTGRILKQYNLQQGNNKIEVMSADYSNGIYNCLLMSNNNVLSYKKLAISK